MMRMDDQTKLVRKPPQRTTMRTGRFCQRSRRSLARSSRLAMSPMGLPASRPKAKKVLIMPAKMATAMPLPKEKSVSPASAFSSGVISCSLETPAAPLTATPRRQTTTPRRMIWPEVWWRMVTNLSVEDGRHDGAEDGAEAEGDGVSEGDTEVADGEAEGDAADSPEDSPEDGVVDAAGVLGVGGLKDGERGAGRRCWRGGWGR